MHIPAGYHEPILTPRAARSVEAAWTYVATTSGQTVVLPDGRCDIIVQFNAQRDIAPIAVVTGPATKPYKVAHTRGDTWVGLRLRPELGTHLWGAHLSAQVNQVQSGLDATTIVPTLVGVLAGNRDVAKLQTALLKLPALQNVPPCPLSLRRALDAVHTSGGRLSVVALAQLIGCSTRQLGRLFQTHIGLSTKTYSQLVRFHRTVALITSTPMDLSQIAIEAGFADQAHMTRDVRQFSGFAPTNLPKNLSQPGFLG